MISLNSSITICGKKIRNRIVMPPMLTFSFGQEDGKVSPRHIAHYEARAKGGAGLIIVEATAVARTGVIAEKQLGLWEDAQINGFSDLAAACHRHGAIAIVQLLHAGVNGNASFSDFAAPSACEAGGKKGYEASEEKIREIIGCFISAAVRAKRAGFDGIELHGAHNYLISRFFDPRSNTRTDAYGGSAENRARIASEILTGIRAQCGNDFILCCRLGANIPDRSGALEIMRCLQQAGADLLHISFGISNEFSPEENRVPDGFPCSVIAYQASILRKQLTVPVISVFGIRLPEQARFLVENDCTDFSAVGMGMLADPDWANKALSGNRVNPCLGCKNCVWNPAWVGGKDPDFCPAARKAAR